MVSQVDQGLQTLVFKCVESLESGFYSYGLASKITFYSKAQAYLEDLLARLHCLPADQKNMWTEEIKDNENELLSAIGALIRKLEKKDNGDFYAKNKNI